MNVTKGKQLRVLGGALCCVGSLAGHLVTGKQWPERMGEATPVCVWPAGLWGELGEDRRPAALLLHRRGRNGLRQRLLGHHGLGHLCGQRLKGQWERGQVCLLGTGGCGRWADYWKWGSHVTV